MILVCGPMKTRLGFSLFEVTVYIAIISVVMVAVLSIVAQTVLNRIKAEALYNVTASTRFAMERIAQDIRQAADIDEGDLASDTLTLTLADGTTHSYSVSSNQLYLATNGGTGVALLPDDIDVTAFTLTDYTSYGAEAKDITVTLSVEQATNNPRPEYQADFSLTTTVSARL